MAVFWGFCFALFEAGIRIIVGWLRDLAKGKRLILNNFYWLVLLFQWSCIVFAVFYTKMQHFSNWQNKFNGWVHDKPYFEELSWLGIRFDWVFKQKMQTKNSTKCIPYPFLQFIPLIAIIKTFYSLKKTKFSTFPNSYGKIHLKLFPDQNLFNNNFLFFYVLVDLEFNLEDALQHIKQPHKICDKVLDEKIVAIFIIYFEDEDQEYDDSPYQFEQE